MMQIELALAIGFAVIMLIVLIVIYNGIITRMNAVERAWTDVITQERQKNKIIPLLENVVKEYKAFEEGLQTKITELRTALSHLSSDKIDSAGLLAAESKTSDVLRGINVAVENYPDLKASEVFNNLMGEIAEQQENIGAAIRIFNKNVEEFNNGIQVFPNSLVNSILNRKSKIEAFKDTEASEGFEYKPNIH